MIMKKKHASRKRTSYPRRKVVCTAVAARVANAPRACCAPMFCPPAGPRPHGKDGEASGAVVDPATPATGGSGMAAAMAQLLGTRLPADKVRNMFVRGVRRRVPACLTV